MSLVSVQLDVQVNRTMAGPDRPTRAEFGRLLWLKAGKLLIVGTVWSSHVDVDSWQ